MPDYKLILYSKKQCREKLLAEHQGRQGQEQQRLILIRIVVVRATKKQKKVPIYESYC